MAISKMALSKNLVVNAEAGINSNGSIKIKAFNFAGVNENATDENIYDVGLALGSLMNGQTDSIVVVERTELISD